MEDGHLTPAPDYSAPEQTPAPATEIPPEHAAYVPHPDPAPAPAQHGPALAQSPEQAAARAQAAMQADTQPAAPQSAQPTAVPPTAQPQVRPAAAEPQFAQPQAQQAATQYAQPAMPSPLPPHSNKMAMSIICTFCCCLLGGIIAIVNASQANSLYSSASFATDPASRQNLYFESERKNKAASTWIWISIISGIIWPIIYGILLAAGVISGSDLLDSINV